MFLVICGLLFRLQHFIILNLHLDSIAVENELFVRLAVRLFAQTGVGVLIGEVTLLRSFRYPILWLLKLGRHRIVYPFTHDFFT